MSAPHDAFDASHAAADPAISDLIADGWQPIRPSAFTALIGPILQRHDGDGPRFCFRVAPKHDNTRDRPHGGMLMAFCDEALGLTAHLARPDAAFVTIGFDCQFIGASRVGEVVEIAPQVTKATASLVFLRGDCTVGGRVIASSSGIWKAVGSRQAASGGQAHAT